MAWEWAWPLLPGTAWYHCFSDKGRSMLWNPHKLALCRAEDRVGEGKLYGLPFWKCSYSDPNSGATDSRRLLLCLAARGRGWKQSSCQVGLVVSFGEINTAKKRPSYMTSNLARHLRPSRPAVLDLLALQIVVWLRESISLHGGRG